MSPDLAIGEVKEHYKSGILGIRMTVHDVKNEGEINWNDYPYWAMKMKRRPQIIKVRAYVFQARDLPAADANGSSDPFARITDCAAEVDTMVIFDNVNPIWYQTLELGYEAASLEDMPPIIVDTYDIDVNTIGKNDLDFLARSVLYIHDIEPYSEGDSVPRPKWYPMFYKKGDPKSGEILMSFSVVEDDYMFKTVSEKINLPKEAGIIMREYNCQMNILGLRNLSSPGIFPVKKANIFFNLKSMVAPDVGDAVENIKTEPSAPGPDPTLNTLIEFDIELPTDRLYCPRMACRVNDNVMMGWN